MRERYKLKSLNNLKSSQLGDGHTSEWDYIKLPITIKVIGNAECSRPDLLCPFSHFRVGYKNRPFCFPSRSFLQAERNNNA